MKERANKMLINWIVEVCVCVIIIKMPCLKYMVNRRKTDLTVIKYFKQKKKTDFTSNAATDCIKKY